MPKDFMNPDFEIGREVEIQPEDETTRLENHILAESFKLGDCNYDKVERQIEELNSMR